MVGAAFANEGQPKIKNVKTLSNKLSAPSLVKNPYNKPPRSVSPWDPNVASSILPTLRSDYY